MNCFRQRAMSTAFVSLAAILTVASTEQQKLRVITPEQSLTAPIEFLGDYSAHGSKKFSSPSELTSLAHSSAQQAKTAVQIQEVASLQASLEAQRGYSRAAQEAATTALVALVAKRAIAQNLQRQIDEAAQDLLQKKTQFRKILEAASSAQEAAQQTQQQLAAATTAVIAVQETATRSQRAAAATARALASQHQRLREAQQRLGLLHDELNESLLGLQQTQTATQKALEAARQAQKNAQSSALLAQANLNSSH